MAGRIKTEDLDALRSMLHLEEIVSQYVTLQRAGMGSLKGLCPFHDEKTASFNVTPDSGLWYCFGCQRGGDTIDFVMQIENLSFVEAVEMLAEKVGYALHYEESDTPYRPAIAPGKRQRLLEAHQLATDFYREQLATPGAGPGREFLAARGFDPGAAALFGIGYSPKNWDDLVRYLRSKGFTDQELVDGGLAVMGKRGLIDFFRGRLMWPIRDNTGATIGFGARKLYDDDPAGKYMNTKETELFHKSKVLYGLDLARKAIAENHRCVIVEGYTDVMAAHLSGIPYAVATCGTAFGEEHAKVVRRLIGIAADRASAVVLPDGRPRGGEVIFTFDGDKAGQAAALKAFHEDQAFAAQSYVAVAAGGMDPCELWMEKGPDAVVALIESRTVLFEFVLRQIIKDIDLHTVEGQVAATRACAPILAEIRDLALQRGYINKVAGWIGVAEAELRGAIQEARRAARQAGGRGNGSGTGSEASGSGARPWLARNTPPLRVQAATADDVVQRVERQCLQAVLRFPKYAVDTGFDEISDKTFSLPAFQLLFQCIQSIGGVGHYQELFDGARQAGLPHPEQAALSRWAGEVRQAGGEVLAQVLAELTAVTLPVSTAEQAREYTREVVARLEALHYQRQALELKGQLNRLEESDPQYNEIFERLMELEEKRRSLQQGY